MTAQITPSQEGNADAPTLLPITRPNPPNHVADTAAAVAFSIFAIALLIAIARFGIRRFLARSNRVLESRPKPAKANLFEGGRRVMMAMQGLVLLAYCAGISLVYLTSNPSVSVWTYGPNAPWVLMSGNCPAGSGTERRYLVELLNERTGAIQFCFVATRADGQWLVPYDHRYDPLPPLPDEYEDWEIVGSIAPIYSFEVQNYMRERVNNFHPNATLVDEISSRWKQMRTKEITAAIYIGAALVAFAWSAIWAFSLFIGWILRGFMGVPLGSDFRENTE